MNRLKYLTAMVVVATVSAASVPAYAFSARHPTVLKAAGVSKQVELKLAAAKARFAAALWPDHPQRNQAPFRENHRFDFRRL